MEDILAEVLDASAMKRKIEPCAYPFIDLISLRTLTTTDIPAIRRMLIKVSQELEMKLVVIGGGYGCTRISITVESDSPEEAKRLLQELFSSRVLSDEALEVGISVLIRHEPYLRKHLMTGEIVGDLPNDGLLLFCSYSHKDDSHRIDFGEHLSALKKSKLIIDWHDRKISAGTEWAGQIDENLEKAHIIVFLVSPAFLSSNYCTDVEMTCALRRHREDKVPVIPVIVRPVDYEGMPFEKLQLVPKDGLAVTSWPNKDEAWTDVAKQIRRVVREVQLSLQTGA
jgi:hypothetical protein